MSQPKEDPLGIRHIFQIVSDAGLELRDDNPELQDIIANQRPDVVLDAEEDESSEIALEDVCS